jgi:hypothetical protein
MHSQYEIEGSADRMSQSRENMYAEISCDTSMPFGWRQSQNTPNASPTSVANFTPFEEAEQILKRA